MQENLTMHLTSDEFRRLGYRAVDLAAEHLAQIPKGPVYRQDESGRPRALDGATASQSADDTGPTLGLH